MWQLSKEPQQTPLLYTMKTQELAFSLAPAGALGRGCFHAQAFHRCGHWLLPNPNPPVAPWFTAARTELSKRKKMRWRISKLCFHGISRHSHKKENQPWSIEIWGWEHVLNRELVFEALSFTDSLNAQPTPEKNINLTYKNESFY